MRPRKNRMIARLIHENFHPQILPRYFCPSASGGSLNIDLLFFMKIKLRKDSQMLSEREKPVSKGQGKAELRFAWLVRRPMQRRNITFGMSICVKMAL